MPRIRHAPSRRITIRRGAASSPPVDPGSVYVADASNTGHRIALTDDARTFISTASVVLTGKRFTASLVTVSGVSPTITDCEFVGELIVRGDGATITHNTIGALSLSGTDTAVVEYNDVPGFVGKDGVHVTSDTGQCGNVTIRRNWVHTPKMSATSHYDSLQIRGVIGALIEENTLDQTGYTGGPGLPGSGLNAALFLENAQGGNTGVIVRRNRLLALGYFVLRVYANDTTQIVDNVISTATGPGGSPVAVITTDSTARAASGNATQTGAPVTV